MPKNADLDGNAPDKSSAALVLVDVINDLEFEGAERLFVHALPMARRIAALKARCKAAGIPVVYLNDNFGHWTSNLHNLVDRCLHSDVRGRPIAELLAPDGDDYFVLKPRHSGFFETPLDLLLRHLEARRLILAGMAGDICVLFTACDAYMRNYDLYVPKDAVASNEAEENERALAYMQRVTKADVTPSTELDLEALRASE